MSIELRQAAEQVLEAFDTFGEDDDFASLFALTQKMNALRTALSQQPATPEPVVHGATHKEPLTGAFYKRIDGIWYVWSRIEDEPKRWIKALCTSESCLHPLYTHPAPPVPEFSRIAKRKLADLQEQGFTITGYAIQCGTQRGFVTSGGFVGWWSSDEEPSVPADVMRDAERYRWLAGCCRSTSEHWGGRWSIIIDGPAPKTHDSEDDLDAAIDAAMLAAKGASA